MESIKTIIQNNPEILRNGLKIASTLKATEPPACAICQDGGWVYPLKDGKPDYTNLVRCRCKAKEDEAKRQKTFLQFCDLPGDSEDRTFETFKTCNEPALIEAYQASKDIVSGKLKFLTLLSDVDRGKSHLAIAICREWLAAGGSAKYAYVPMLLDELRAGFEQQGDYSYQSRFNFYCKVGLLILDDLGAESKTSWAIEKLETITDYRYINGLSTVVTTNCALDCLPIRIKSRLQRVKNSKVVVIDSPEYRKVKGGNHD